MRRSYNSGRAYKPVISNDANLAMLLRLVATIITSTFGADVIDKDLHRLLEHYHGRLDGRLAGIRFCRVFLLVDVPGYLWSSH